MEVITHHSLIAISIQYFVFLTDDVAGGHGVVLSVQPPEGRGRLGLGLAGEVGHPGDEPVELALHLLLLQPLRGLCKQRLSLILADVFPPPWESWVRSNE